MKIQARLIAASIVGVLVTVGVFVGVPGTRLPVADAAVPVTTVTLTFDDGHADQAAAAATLKANSLVGTFFINSGFTDGAGFMTRAQLSTLFANGNEIGGHTVSHFDLTAIAPDEAQRQVCNDRATLTGWGFPITSFAYPFSTATPAVEAIAKACGYNSARGLGDLRSRFGCQGCAYAETTPPPDLYYTRALDEVDSTWTLADLKKSVTNVQPKGGWVQLTFHRICAVGCDPLAVTPTIFAQFASWLKTQTTTVSTTSKTVVRTVGQVIGGPVLPLVTAPVPPTAATGTNLLTNASLESASASGLPTCWQTGGYGLNTAVFARVTSAHSGAAAERVSITGYSSGDAKLLPTLDLGSCTPPVTAGHSYSLRGWYTATTATQFAVYLRNSQGVWEYWTSSPWFAASTTWAQAAWTSPVIPAGYTSLSFGLNIFANGSIVTDDYGLFDSIGAPPL
jgi:hypothetical protein